MEIRTLETQDELVEGFAVLRLLRTHLDSEAFHRLYHQAAVHDAYTLVGAFEGTVCTAVMGYRVLYDFVHGKHLYIDDLVVVPERRSQGIGEKMLAHAEDAALQLGCVSLRLCTGVENDRGRKFYTDCGWTERAVAFKKAFE